MPRVDTSRAIMDLSFDVAFRRITIFEPPFLRDAIA